MIKLYHNPKCSTSRTTLALLEARALKVEVIDYLKTPPNKKTLTALAKKMPRALDLLRTKEPLAKELGLKEADANTIIDAIYENPILLNRPIAETDTRALACRPAELILDFITDPS